MARVYSQSQGKFIETGTAQTPQNTAMPAQAGTDPNAALKLKYLKLMMANPKQYTALNAMYEKEKVPELSAKEIEDQQKKSELERVVAQLEDLYLGSKLHYGNNMKGALANTIMPVLQPGTPLARYKALVDSSGAFLAKAAGDAGNIAYQEQLLSKKPIPNARFNKKDAISAFGDVREKFGLPKRDYDEILNTKANTKMGIQSLGVQFGGK
jgi:hypothetical protein